MTTIPSAGTSRPAPVEFSEGSGRGGLVNGSGVIAALVRRGFTAMARIPVSIIPAIAMPDGIEIAQILVQQHVVFCSHIAQAVFQAHINGGIIQWAEAELSFRLVGCTNMQEHKTG